MEDPVRTLVLELTHQPTHNCSIFCTNKSGNVLEKNQRWAHIEDRAQGVCDEIPSAFGVIPSTLETEKRIRLAWKPCHEHVNIKRECL